MELAGYALISLVGLLHFFFNDRKYKLDLWEKRLNCYHRYVDHLLAHYLDLMKKEKSEERYQEYNERDRFLLEEIKRLFGIKFARGLQKWSMDYENNIKSTLGETWEPVLGHYSITSNICRTELGIMFEPYLTLQIGIRNDFCIIKEKFQRRRSRWRFKEDIKWIKLQEEADNLSKGKND